VGEPGAPRFLVRRTNVVPDVHRHERQAVVLRQDDVQAVWQRELLERDVRYVGHADARRRRLPMDKRSSDDDARGDEAGQGRAQMFHREFLKWTIMQSQVTSRKSQLAKSQVASHGIQFINGALHTRLRRPPHP